MPDIFGREAHDYEHIVAAQRIGAWDDHNRAIQQAGENPHNFVALGTGPGDPGLQRAEPNAQAIGFVTNNLQAIVGVVQEVLYLNNRLMDHVPIRTDVAEGAKTYQHRVVDMTGKGRFITTDGTDAPRAGASLRALPVNLDYGGIDGLWTVEDLRAAMFAGFPLDSATLMAAAQGAINHIEEVAFIGDASRGWKGITNLPTTGGNKVMLTTLANQTFSTQTADQIVTILQDAISKVIQDSKEILPRVLGGELHVMLPTSQFDLVVTRRYGEDANRSIADYVQMFNAWTKRGGTLRFTSMPELDGAGAGATDRLVVYLKRTEVLEQAHAISPRVLRVLDQGRTICAQFEYKVGPLFVGRPSTVQYYDGV